MQQELGMAVFLITHDLGVVAEVCDHVMVMYAGRIVESTSTKELFLNPKHPYTVGLLESIPQLGAKVSKLKTISGMVPSLDSYNEDGCRFYGRCSKRMDKCKNNTPPLKNFTDKHQLACWLYH